MEVSNTGQKPENHCPSATHNHGRRPLFINFNEYTEGDKEYKKELVLLIINNLEEFHKALVAALHQGDTRVFLQACHKGKVTLGILEDQELIIITDALKKNIANRDNSDQVMAGTLKFEQICRSIIDSLKAEIKHSDNWDRNGSISF